MQKPETLTEAGSHSKELAFKKLSFPETSIIFLKNCYPSLESGVPPCGKRAVPAPPPGPLLGVWVPGGAVLGHVTASCSPGTWNNSGTRPTASFSNPKKRFVPHRSFRFQQGFVLITEQEKSSCRKISCGENTS